VDNCFYIESKWCRQMWRHTFCRKILHKRQCTHAPIHCYIMLSSTQLQVWLSLDTVSITATDCLERTVSEMAEISLDGLCTLSSLTVHRRIQCYQTAMRHIHRLFLQQINVGNLASVFRIQFTHYALLRTRYCLSD